MAAVSALASREPGSVGVRARRERAHHWLDRLGPGPARGSWDESWLDGVRACAVLLVVVLHVWADSGRSRVRLLGLDLTWIPATMSFGVTIFFVLSGYLLARPWFVVERTGGAPPRATTFWRRRLLRIVPAYWLSIAVVLILFVPAHLIPREAVTGRTGAGNLGGQLLFLQGYLPISSGNLNTINGAYWTLTVEMTLYLLLPFLVPLFLGRRALVALPVALAGALTWVYLATERLDGLVRTMTGSITETTAAAVSVPRTEQAMRTLLFHAFPTWLFVFALGIALARLSVAHEFRTREGVSAAWWQQRSTSWTAIALGSVLLVWDLHETGTATSAHFNRITMLYLPQVAGPAALALILWGLTVGSAGARRPLNWAPLRFVGWTSYGIYLFHLPSIAFLHQYTGVARLGPVRHFLVLLVLDLALAIAAGTASWLLVERPLLRRRAKRVAPAVATDTPSASGDTRLRHWHWPQLALVLGAAAAAAAVVVTSMPTPTVTAMTGGLFARGMTRAQVNEKLSGSVTLSQAAARGLMYPVESTLLTTCAAGRGSTALVVNPDWSTGATAFPCANEAAAAKVLHRLANWESTAGFRPVASPVDGVAVYFRDQSPPTPTHPDQFHVRFTSGRWVVGFAIQATSVEAGQEAIVRLHAALGRRLRVS